MSLIDIGTRGIAIQDALFESQGELTPEMEAALDALLAEGAASLDAAAWVVRLKENDAETCRAEAARLIARAKGFDGEATALKARMLFAVDAAFDGKLKTATNTIYGQNSAPTTGFELAADADLAKIAETDGIFVRRRFELDKQALKQYHDAGEKLPDGILVVDNPGKRSLRIR